MTMSTIVTGDRYLEHLVRFVDRNTGPLLDGTLTLKLNPVGLHYVQSRLEALQELEGLLAGAPVDYLRAYVSDLGDHRALEQLRRILSLLTSLKVISVLPPPTRDPTPLSLLPFGRLRFLELRGCDLSTSTARGLLELRHTLEKLICHNSTDALRHVFASRIVDIKESPVWNRLSFVSCACNGLVLMDESLQLLPVVETLDLSRNQFAKVANLRKCTKLQLLDLGYNHLRSIVSLGEVSSRIVKLVLKNNALTTLHGIENLKSVEGLDLSYNIISSFTELEIVASLPCLHSLWLEGNPICCARWYRAHVFCFFSHPEELTLDENRISTREFWERHIILASRQKQPVGYGFYFPAKDDSEDESTLDTKRNKYYRRLASIEDEEQRRDLCSEAVEQDSVSCESDIQRKDDNAISDSESEITDLMNKIEYMKKERSVHWLREFKEWMDQTHDYAGERSQYRTYDLDPGRGNNIMQREGERLLGESSGSVPVEAQASDVDSILNVSQGNKSFDSNGRVGLEDQMVNGNGVNKTYLEIERIGTEQEQVGDHPGDPQNLSLIEVRSISSTPLTAIDEIIGSRASSVYPGSPPHYQENILQRRLYLEEEFLLLSAESQSLASSGSDSDTSCSEDDYCRLTSSGTELDNLLLAKSIELDITDNSTMPHKGNHQDGMHQEISSSKFCYGSNFNTGNCFLPNHDQPFVRNYSFEDASSCDHNLGRYESGMDNQKGKQKLRRRFVSLSGNSQLCDTGPEFQEANGILDGSKNSEGDGKEQLSCNELFINDFSEGSTTTRFYDNQMNDSPAEPISFHSEQDLFIKDFFHLEVADVRASEACQQLVRCECIYQLESVFHESEVALLRSCKHRLFLLLIDVIKPGQEIISKVLGCYSLEEVREVVVGLGLQALRVYMERDASYLFLPRTAEKAKDLLSLLGVDDFTASSTACSLRRFRSSCSRNTFVEV